jgi:hypothetical protein
VRSETGPELRGRKSDVNYFAADRSPHGELPKSPQYRKEKMALKTAAMMLEINTRKTLESELDRLVEQAIQHTGSSSPDALWHPSP